MKVGCHACTNVSPGSERHGVFGAKEFKNNRKNDERKTYDEIKIFFSFAGGSGLSKMTLLYHRSTSGLNTSVTTKNGVVT